MNKNNWQQFRVLIWLLSLTWGGAAAATSQPDIAKAIVGEQQILIPVPDSFSQATSQKLIQFGELSTIKEDRLLAVFGTISDVREEAKGRGFLLDRYGFAQATRNVEHYQIPLNIFAKYKADTKAQVLAGLTAEERVEIQKNIERTKRWIESSWRVKSQTDVPRLGSTSILDETPTSLTVVTKGMVSVSVAGGKQKSVEMVAGSSQLLVKSKVIWLQLYARSKSQEDFDWVAKNIIKWTRAVTAANN